MCVCFYAHVRCFNGGYFMIFFLVLIFNNIRIMFDDIFDIDDTFTDAKTKPKNKNTKIIPKFDPNALSDCLCNLPYPSCNLPNHQCQPMSLVCIDQECQNKSLICAFCENEKHYKHMCVPLKFYLNQVYGQILEEKIQETAVMRSEPEIMPMPKQKTKKNKGKNKPTVQVKNSPISSTTYITSSPTYTHQNILSYVSKIQNQKVQFLKLIAQYRQSLIEKLHNFETISTKFFNSKIQQVSKLITLENPIENIEKMVNNIQNFKNAAEQATKSEEVNKYNKLLSYETKKLQRFIQSILETTRVDSKFDLPQRLTHLISKNSQIFTQIRQSLQKINTKYEEEITKCENILEKELELKLNIEQFSKLSLKFSQQYKGHKFVIKNQGKLAEQTGMESSGQRFLLLQPSLPKKLNFNGRIQTWGIKLIKLAGWIAVGIALKNKIANGKYVFTYSNIGHGSYLISANGYCWSHSLLDFNSAYKSFPFVVGDTVYMQYNPVQKKLKFFKNANNTNSFELDIVDPPENDEYCPCVNMCSTGDTVELVEQKPSFL